MRISKQNGNCNVRPRLIYLRLLKNRAKQKAAYRYLGLRLPKAGALARKSSPSILEC